MFVGTRVVTGGGACGALPAGVRGGVHKGAARASREGHRQEREGHPGDRGQERRGTRQGGGRQ